MNVDLERMFPVEHFAACVAFRYDADTHRLEYSSAGGPPPILISGETGEAQVLHSPAGTLLGYLSDTPFGTMLVHVKKGDKFLLFSDALFEDGDPEKCISIEDVADLAASLLATGGSADFPARLVRRLKGDTPLHDDLSLIFVEFEGSAS